MELLSAESRVIWETERTRSRSRLYVCVRVFLFRSCFYLLVLFIGFLRLFASLKGQPCKKWVFGSREKKCSSKVKPFWDFFPLDCCWFFLVSLITSYRQYTCDSSYWISKCFKPIFWFRMREKKWNLDAKAIGTSFILAWELLVFFLFKRHCSMYLLGKYIVYLCHPRHIWIDRPVSQHSQVNIFKTNNKNALKKFAFI